jgi:hypothetical protein
LIEAGGGVQVGLGETLTATDEVLDDPDAPVFEELQASRTIEIDIKSAVERGRIHHPKG